MWSVELNHYYNFTVAVFSTREKAEAWVKLMNEGGKASVKVAEHPIPLDPTEKLRIY